MVTIHSVGGVAKRIAFFACFALKFDALPTVASQIACHKTARRIIKGLIIRQK